MTDPEDVYRRAHRLAEVGRFADAERAARTGLAAAPGSGRLLVLLAWVLRMRRDYPAALAAADAAIGAVPGFADAFTERAEALIALVRATDAVAAAREAVRLEPFDPAGHLVLARGLAAARRTGEARAAAAHGLALAPRSVEGLLTVAEVERAAGHRDEAVSAARAALAIEPANSYGRWLIAMLDAERLRVRRSMRALREVARDHPGRPDVISMTWPIRGVLSGLRRGLAAGGALICVLLLAADRWPPLGDFARLLSVVLAAVLIGFALRVFVPAGRLPWRCLRLVPRLTRRATTAGLATGAVAVAALIAHGSTGWWPLAVTALLLAGPLWAFGFLELLGAGLDDPGLRHVLFEVAGELRDWWRTTRRDLRAAWRNGR